MIRKDPRYHVVRLFIQKGEIQSFEQIFYYIPKAVVYNQLKINFNRFRRLLTNPEKFPIDIILQIAGFIEVDVKLLLGLIFKDIKKNAVVVKKSTDMRYNVARIFIEKGEVTSFRQIFDYLPKTLVYHDLQINYNRFQKILNKPGSATLEDVLKLSELVQQEKMKIFDLLYAEIKVFEKNKKPKTGKK